MKSFYSNFKTLRNTILTMWMLLMGSLANAQTTLAPGDIVFTSFDVTSTSSATVADKFSFVLLKNISAGTVLSFSDRGYNGSGWQVPGSAESCITWTVSSAIPMGTEIYVVGLQVFSFNQPNGTSTQIGTATVTDGGTSINGLTLSTVGDQIFIFQGGSGNISGSGVTLIAGLNTFYSASSTSTAWNVGASYPNPNASLMPPGLTGGVSAFYPYPTGATTQVGYGKFNCIGVPSSAIGTQTAVMNVGNWSIATGATVQYSGCQFLATLPVITTQPTNKNICALSNTTFSITETGASSYQWRVSTNSGVSFSDIANGGFYSGATTATLSITGATSGLNNYQYQCVATNSSGSVTSTAATLNVRTIALASSQTNIACYNAATGVLSVSPSGGTTPYTYSWSNGSSASMISGLSAGAYSVTVTDATGCIATRNFTVTQPSSAVSGTTVVTNVACNGGSTGAINLTPTGGTAPYTFLWNGGITTEDRTGLAAGSYSVTITDANGCTGVVNATVTQPTAISATTVVTNIACFGASTGAINLTPSGGVGPYTFNWGGGITTEDRTGLTAGSYSVIITDANSCTKTINVTVTQPTSAVSGSTVVTNVACNGGSTGTINLTPTGGTAPYTFLWNGGLTTEDRTGLAAGSYSVTITDANGCTGVVNVTVTQPASAVSGTTVVTNVACNGGSTGAINLTPTGGTAPYTFLWNGGVTTEDRTGLAAGSYSVTITDANGCTGVVNATVTQPASAVSGTTVVTNVSCNGGSNGTINLTPTGGTAPYTFLWNGGATTEDRTGLAAGSYSVTITDANGCTGVVNATVTQPTAISATTVVTNIACFGASTGAINLTPTGGVGPYTFNWGGGITTEDRTGLAAGSYSVIITDANSCTKTINVTVTQPTSAVSGSTVVTNVACNGGSTGTINLTPTGGTAPYTFLWNGGATTEDRTSLAAGSYSVTITDANGCTGVVNATVTQPTAISGSTVVTNVACNGGLTGAINLTPTGGTAPYTFLWNGGVTTEDRTGLAAGSYSVTITDANGCTGVVNATVTQPASAVSGTTVVTNVACNGGSTGAINLTPTGGTAPYTFLWNGGVTTEDRTGLTAGSYSVTITDANGCTGVVNATVTQPTAISATTVVTNIACFGASTGAINLTPTGGVGPYTFNWGGGITTEDRTGLSAGSYSVTITDANSCTRTVNVTVTQPSSAVSGTTVVTNVACNGGSTGAINLTPTGGTAPYTFLWNGGATTEDRTGLSAGSYSVTITDANGCTGVVNATVTQPASAVSGTTVVTNVACNGGSTGAINLTPTGGTAPYTFLWNGGATTEDRTGLAAGSYSVTITDANGCTGVVNATVTQPTVLTASTTVTNVACNGGSNGTAAVSVSGGTAPYTYAWSNSATTAIITGIAAGTYSVVITDANACSITRNFTVTQPTAMTATVTQTNVTCNGGNNGSATVNVTGGAGGYTYLWSNNATTASINGLTAGVYNVTITDANACTIVKTVTITQSSAIAAPTGATTQSYNAGDTLNALVVTGTGIKWYASAADAANHTGSLALSTPIAFNTTYYATQTVGSCESTLSLAVLAYNASLATAETVKSKADLQIYPNPVREILNISGKEKINKVVIFSADGKKVTEKTLTNGERGINVESLVQGVYLIQIFTEKDLQTFKFIKK